MRHLVLGLASIFATLMPATSAVARPGDRSGFANSGGFAMHRDRGEGCGAARMGDRGRHRGRCALATGYGYGYVEDGWALYNNRSWSEDSYNDWWHDRPDRAYPRWMSNNRDCARQYYMGDVLTC